MPHIFLLGIGELIESANVRFGNLYTCTNVLPVAEQFPVKAICELLLQFSESSWSVLDDGSEKFINAGNV